MFDDSRPYAVPRASTLRSNTLPAPRTLRASTPRTSTPRPDTPRVSLVTNDRTQLAAGMTATLSAELDGRVPIELVADIVRAVLDENRQAAKGGGAESAKLEARARLERFIRARSTR